VLAVAAAQIVADRIQDGGVVVDRDDDGSRGAPARFGVAHGASTGVAITSLLACAG
jgi:hypothetical protein